MTHDFDYEQMLKGELYIASNIHHENSSIHGKKIAQQINTTPIEKRDKIQQLVKQLVGQAADNVWIEPPVYVDYGKHIKLGQNFYANMACTFLDVNHITFGDNVMIGPNTSFYTAGHPTDPVIRNEGYEFGYPITVHDNVWIGGHVTVLPNVTIGENSIVAAGSVVTKDVPANTIVAGNPAKVIRQITEDDFTRWDELKQKYLAKKAEL